MTNEKLRELANEVLVQTALERCGWDYNEETGEYAPGGCEEGAACEVEGPHEERCGFYCAEHAKRTKEERCTPPHRYLINQIPGVEGIAAARRFALAYLESTATAEPPGLDVLPPLTNMRLTVTVSGDDVLVDATESHVLGEIRDAVLNRLRPPSRFQGWEWEIRDDAGTWLDPAKRLDAYPRVLKTLRLYVCLPVGAGA